MALTDGVAPSGAQRVCVRPAEAGGADLAVGVPFLRGKALQRPFVYGRRSRTGSFSPVISQRASVIGMTPAA